MLARVLPGLFFVCVSCAFVGCGAGGDSITTHAVLNLITDGIWKNEKRVIVPTDRPPNRCDLYFLVKFGQFDDLERIFAERRTHSLGFYQGYHPLYALYGEMNGFGEPFSDEQWEAHFSQLKAWSAAYPDSPAPHVAAAEALITYAWSARYKSYGQPQSAETQALEKSFTQRLERAREGLLLAERCAVQESTIYRTHIIVAMGLRLPLAEMERLLARGTALQPNDQLLYEVATKFLSPWWRGRQGEWETFVTREADRVGGEEGDILYMALARSLATSYDGKIFSRSRMSWDRMRRGFAATGRRNPEYLWDIHSYCYFACLADDRPTARALFKHLGDSREPGVWTDEATFTRWKAWAETEA